MNIAIVGFAVEGQAIYHYFAGQGHELTICDQNEWLEVPAGAQTQLGIEYLHNLDRFDLIVRTPGLHPKLILEQNPTVGPKITTAINEFLKVCPTKNIIGVTGTKGKGTTSTLITLMLGNAGKRVHLGGNIGKSPFTFLHEIDFTDWVVLELSSFQLIDLQQSPHIGVCLMVVPEHLNWHADMTEYVQAKAQLFAHQTKTDIAIYYAKNEVSEEITAHGAGRMIPYYQRPGAYIDGDELKIDGMLKGKYICKTSELKLLGKHNWQNACAAATAVWQIAPDREPIRSVLTSFSGLPHRLEFVRELAGVRYYNDSFGTTPETAIVALQSFEQPKVVILGGSDKGASYEQLAQTVARSNVRSAVLIGDTAPAIEQALHRTGFTHTVSGGTTMDEIVHTAAAQAETGDVVLLSTGCASFGLFTDYKDRGEQFVATVQHLS